ncbi:BolA family protein [Falsihalocynthiibacter sp. SS001]|uniref:BolA family protein n=1 Tax=Falsihalocynthiibacter sp. SS001 TaxID=3349698 RepID=UPI0036D2BAAC
MTIESEIHDKLTSAFSPTTLQVVNESHLHAGHSGDDGSGESHFRVVIQSDSFEGMSRIARHRAVHAAIGPDLIARIHALGLEINAAS